MLNSDSSPTFSQSVNFSNFSLFLFLTLFVFWSVIASTPVAKIACDEMPPPKSGTARKPIKKNQSRRISFSDSKIYSKRKIILRWSFSYFCFFLELSFRSKTPDEDVQNFPVERKSNSDIVPNNVSEAPAENESEVFLSNEINENHPEAIETRSKTFSSRSSSTVKETHSEKSGTRSKSNSIRSSLTVNEYQFEKNGTHSKSNSIRSSSTVNKYQLGKNGTRSKSNSTRSSSGMNENQLEIGETGSKSISTRSSSGMDEIQLDKIETRSKSNSARSSAASSIKHFADTTSNYSQSGCIRRKKRRISFESFLEPPEICTKKKILVILLKLWDSFFLFQSFLIHPNLLRVADDRNVRVSPPYGRGRANTWNTTAMLMEIVKIRKS